jgi:hypothetical protein
MGVSTNVIKLDENQRKTLKHNASVFLSEGINPKVVYMRLAAGISRNDKVELAEHLKIGRFRVNQPIGMSPPSKRIDKAWRECAKQGGPITYAEIEKTAMVPPETLQDGDTKAAREVRQKIDKHNARLG